MNPKSDRETGPITVRHPQFHLSDTTSAAWLGGDAFRSQFFNSLSMIFPSGERYFIDSLRRVMRDISDPRVREHVLGFIGQESSHHRIHADFNRSLERLGLRNVVEPFIEWRIRHSGPVGPLDHAAITAGVEYFTSLLGEATLTRDGWLAGGPPELQALWKWHAAEEIEHGFIPLEVYGALGGGYLRRVVWFFYVSVTLSVDALIQTICNLHRTGAMWCLETWTRGGRLHARARRPTPRRSRRICQIPASRICLHDSAGRAAGA